MITARCRSLSCRVGQNRIYTLYMTVYLVTSLPKIPYIHHIYIYIYIWFWPTLLSCDHCSVQVTLLRSLLGAGHFHVITAVTTHCHCFHFRVGQNDIYTVYIHGVFGREITKYTLMYGVYIRFWPTLFNLRCTRPFLWCTDTHARDQLQIKTNDDNRSPLPFCPRCLSGVCPNNVYVDVQWYVCMA